MIRLLQLRLTAPSDPYSLGWSTGLAWLSLNWDNCAVRRILAADEKPLHWVGSSKRDFLKFPVATKEDMGNAWHRVVRRNRANGEAVEGARSGRIGDRRVVR